MDLIPLSCRSLRISGTVLCILSVAILLIAAGCMQPEPPPPPDPAATVTETTLPVSIPAYHRAVTATATKPDATTIVITYLGGPDADQLMELQTTVTDNTATIRTQSMGSRLDTTPAQTGGKTTFHGPFKEKTHVTRMGYFADGTHEDILDIWI